jgi:hypothetical protein
MTELVSIPGHWDFDYVYFAGEAASRWPRARVRYVPGPQGRSTDFAFVLA